MKIINIYPLIMWFVMFYVILVMGAVIYSGISETKECKMLAEELDMLKPDYKSGGLFSNSECWAINNETKERLQIG